MNLRPHHTAISVRDLKKTLDFYEKLGFTQVHRYDDEDKIGVKIKLGNYFLEIFAYHKNIEAPAAVSALGGSLDVIGIKHIALQADDIEAALTDMKAKGLADDSTEILTKGDELGEARFFFIQDPNGIWVEFINDPRYS
jgi:catechol 2,3-dioxygenase-like lactoylglutathione lyase family enzyme